MVSEELMGGAIVAVVHEEFKKRMGVEDVSGFMGDKPVLVDVRGMIDATIAEEVRVLYRDL